MLILLNRNTQKLVDIGSNLSSTDTDVNMSIEKPWTAIESSTTKWKSDLSNEIKWEYFQDVTVLALLYGCTTYTWTKRQEKKPAGNYTRMLRTVLNKFCYRHAYFRGAFNKFPDFFVQPFKIVVDSWKFSILLLYILWDDWPIFRISSSNEQLQQQLEYTLLKSDCHSRWISKMQSGREDTLEERYAIKFCFKLEKNAMRWKLDLLLWPRDQETEFPVKAYWLSQTQESQTEQIHPQIFDNPFFWQHWYDLHTLGSH